jgi:hypothetical protein
LRWAVGGAADPAASPEQLALKERLVTAVDRLRQGYGESTKAFSDGGTAFGLQ